MINVKINNNNYQVDDDKTILETCHKLGIKIPTLCYLKDINEIASCRMCIVELNNKLVTACSEKVFEGMEVLTNSLKVMNSRKTTLELLLSTHNKDCLNCFKSGSCELQKLCEIYGVNANRYENSNNHFKIDDSTCIVRDNSKCILCNRCVNFCKNIQNVEAISRIDRGIETHIGSAFDLCLDKSNCVLCGGCVNVCPTGALREKSNIDDVITALNNPSLQVVVAYAPSVRVAIGEEFGFADGEIVTGKLNTALKLTGFSKVFDITYGADFTVIEEATEFLTRLTNNYYLPMFTSCCPGWVNYVLKHHKELKNNLSSCKSPQQMFGSICKTYYAKSQGINPKNIYVVSIMPCIAKKDEINNRDYATKYKDVDCVITTRELSILLKKYGFNLQELNNTDFDKPMGKGNSVIFGTSGGVMETSLRYIKEQVEHKKYHNLEFKEVRGMSGLKEATYCIGKEEIRVLVVSGLGNIDKAIKQATIKNYHFIEVMACPGGCINGAGQPYIDGYRRSFSNYKIKRSHSLYSIEKKYKSNKARDNIYAKKVYKEFFDKPNSKMAEKILHTVYNNK